jgi:uncharacterized protein (DUF305 family)
MMELLMKTTTPLAAACLLALSLAIAAPAIAETTDAHSGHDMTDMAGMSSDSPATEAYRQANMSMHTAMDIDYTGDADVDFIKGMIPHHQGAVEMARIVLAHGTDPAVRALAEGIIAAQEAEIAFMTDWLKQHGQ